MWFLSEETNLPRRRRYTVADELRIGLQELLRKAQMEGITGGVCRTSESAVNRKFNFGEFPFHALG
jgi:hypothetical protein